MRLWHQDLISKLPRAQLLGQHRECAALRGNAWGKKHLTVDYVFQYSTYRLYAYHSLVISEMTRRGYNHDARWDYELYRGKNCEPWPPHNHQASSCSVAFVVGVKIYPEHNDTYLQECLENLRTKGIEIE